MKIDIIAFSVIALILLAAMHGVFIRWHNTHGTPVPYADPQLEELRQAAIKRWSKVWHKLALAVRVFIWLIVWLVCRDWLIFSLVVVLTAFEYNISINLINNLKWYYVGTTSMTDQLIRKLLPFINW